MGKTAIIIGAGPAGLTAAVELLERTDIQPIILEKTGDIGGLSKTVSYNGNRMDIGGHRFFSKSDRVMDWWLRFLPLDPAALADGPVTIGYHRQSRPLPALTSFSSGTQPPASSFGTPPATSSDSAGTAPKTMLLRRRLSRIYFLRKFFDYPISLSIDTLRKLGFRRTVAIVASFGRAWLFPRKPEKSLEDFLVNRFGYTLYRLFFAGYTEKVWGVPCPSIPPEWGEQRIRGVSFRKALAHALASARRPNPDLAAANTDLSGTPADLAQKDVETSLIDRFLYPPLGPGQLWEEAARRIEAKGGRILFNQEIVGLTTAEGRITAVETLNTGTGEKQHFAGDHFFSSMPVQELVAGLRTDVPLVVREVAAGLQYRDFITVGLLLRRLSANGPKGSVRLDLRDTWIYIQESAVRVGRLQLYNNWSPYLVRDQDTVWIGMEYFCNKGDAFWVQTDTEIQETAIRELCEIGLARREDLLDSTVIRMEKTYPAYFGTYDRFGMVRDYLDTFPNLWLIGRNGMHKYNNSDHSMLTAMAAVDNICAGIDDKSNIWAINTEQEYHESTKTSPAQTGSAKS